MIANPPYTRAGGPGDAENKAWNPLFGDMTRKEDQKKMQEALDMANRPTAANGIAGLGSSFLVLAHQNVRQGGRIAFVLPSTAITGEQWSSVRELLLKYYDVEWVITSHDARKRSKANDLPGRDFVSFSESTTMAEALIVATKRPGVVGHRYTRFVNLAENALTPGAAVGISRALLALEPEQVELRVHEKIWGQVCSVEQAKLTRSGWHYNSFIQVRLYEEVSAIETQIALAELQQCWELGPYHLNIRGSKQGLFAADHNPAPDRYGHPALWHHKADRITSICQAANAWLTPKPGKSRSDCLAMLRKAGRVQLALELRTTTQRVGGVLTDKAMLGIRSWVSLRAKNPRVGLEETLVLWLNSTPGLVTRILHANRPYLGRTGLVLKTAKTLPVLDIDDLPDSALEFGKKQFDLLTGRLQPWYKMDLDPLRKEIDDAIEKITGYNKGFGRVRRMLSLEPILCGEK